MSRTNTVLETGVSKQSIVTQLTKSSHGDLSQYVVVGQTAVREEGDFFAHLISWNGVNGQIRDSKVALPVIQLSAGPVVADFSENALAHLAVLDPRQLLKAVVFSRQLKTPGYKAAVKKLVWRYLTKKAENTKKWDRLAIQHRESLVNLYKFYGTHIPARVNNILFKGKYPKGSIFAAVAELKSMSAPEAAGTITEMKIPFLIARAALAERAKEPDLLMALIDRMSATELVTNMRQLEKLGVKTNPALRAALTQALERSATSNKPANLFKTSVATGDIKGTRGGDTTVEDEGIREKLRSLQEKQIKKIGIDGNWLVLGDKSGSMQNCIEATRHIAGTLAKMVKGQVHLAFFDSTPYYMNVTGKTYEEILKLTQNVAANGGTSIGCGLRHAVDRNLDFDGIAVVSDGGENNAPRFVDVYKQYEKASGRSVPVYFYLMEGSDANSFAQSCRLENVELQTFDLTHGKVDYYSLPNLVQTMRVNRYSLIDDIMESRLLTVDGVLGLEKE